MAPHLTQGLFGKGILLLQGEEPGRSSKGADHGKDDQVIMRGIGGQIGARLKGHKSDSRMPEQSAHGLGVLLIKQIQNHTVGLYGHYASGAAGQGMRYFHPGFGMEHKHVFWRRHGIRQGTGCIVQ
ncbi:hypothetical protein ES703_112911 [subsurface metagenome]